jgi:glycosyltransferase involved in cell wall biosynthesis
MKILFLSRWFPYPPDNGSKLRILNLIRGLAQSHQVTLLSFAEQLDIVPNSTEIHSICENIQIIPWKEYRPQSTRALLSYFSTKPRSVEDTFSIAMANRIQNITANSKSDLIIASQIYSAGYYRYWGQVPALFEEIELGVPYEHYRNATLGWRHMRYGLAWEKHRRYLARLLRNFEACTVVSEQELRLLKKSLPSTESVVVIPNCINGSDYQDVDVKPEQNSMIFTGSFRYLANHDAMTWFLQEVYPLIKAKESNASLTITGDHASLPLPSSDDVTLTGHVEDVRPLIASAWMSLVPLRVGGGTRLKILEAMALSTPVVSTSKGAEGLNVKHNVHILIADTPETFAEQVIRLLRDPDLRKRLVSNAYKLVQNQYNWAVVMPKFLDLVERVASS